MKLHPLKTALLFSLGTLPAFGADLETMVVTATRTSQSIDDALASVTVIDRQTIERLQARSIDDLLRALPGIGVVNNGGPGKATSLFLRGTESDHLLVLIDGVRVGSATTGTTPWQFIPVEEIERIEIVRGPRSSLYGSEAIGGVIQIFTRGAGDRLRSFFSAGMGSYRTFEGSAGISGRFAEGRGWFGTSISALDTAGFNACEGAPWPPGGGCYTYEFDDDGHRNQAGSLRAGYRLGGGLEVEFNLLRSDSRTWFDGSYVNHSESVEQVIGTTLRYAVSDTWRLALSLGRSRDDSDNYKDGLFMSRFDTTRETATLQSDLVLGDDTLTLGIDHRDDRVGSTTVYEHDSRDDKGLFAQYQATRGDHEVVVSARRDDDSQFGTRHTGSLAWGYRIGDALRLTASWGSAFKAPTFNELYYPGYGNPDLRPEESDSVEVGLRGDARGVAWSVNLYQTDIDDLIAFDMSTFLPGNVDEARIRGLEASAGLAIAGWQVDTALTLLDPENRSGGFYDGNRLPRRSDRTLRIDADRAFGGFSLGMTLVAEGSRYDDLANTAELGGYATIDLRAEYRFDANWRLQGRVVNLLDKAYETAGFYNQPGRGLYLTLRYNR